LTRAARDVDGVEADVALARGRLIHARYLRERAAGAAEPTEELTSRPPTAVTETRAC
jgi:hypothetical protein